MYTQDNKNTFRYKFRQQISISKSHRSRIQKGVIKGDQFYIVKIIKCKDMSQLLFYKQILFERTQIQRQLNSQSIFSSQIVVQTVKEINNTNSQEQNYLHIFYPFYPTNSLIGYTSSSTLKVQRPISQLQKSQKIINLICKICVKLMRSSNKQLYTFQTFMFDQNNGQIVINPISFVGMQLMMFDQEISQPNFIQIYELLGSSTLKKQPKNRFSIQLKFRAIGILFLSMLLSKQLKLLIDKKHLQPNSQKTILQNYIGLTNSIPQKFKTILSIKMIRDKIAVIDTKYKVNYFEFLLTIFVEQKELTWTNVLDLIIPKEYSNPLNINPPLKAVDLAKLYYRCNAPIQSQQCILESLGLKKQNQMKIYFLILISQEDVNTEQLLKYEDIDEYIYDSHHINMQNKSIYKKIMKLVSNVLQKHNFEWSQSYFDEPFLNPKITQVLTQLQIESLQNFIFQLSLKFGVIQKRKQNRRYCQWQKETQGLNMYRNLFK